MAANDVELYYSLRNANMARQREIDPAGRITPLFRGVELAGEVGEALNVLKKLERERMGIAGSRATVPQLADELADAMICIDLLAMDYGIDLQLAVQRKFNDTSEKRGVKTRLSLRT